MIVHTNSEPIEQLRARIGRSVDLHLIHLQTAVLDSRPSTKDQSRVCSAFSFLGRTMRLALMYKRREGCFC
jgi:hypothetical protein